ncbi:carboxymuconolactone decarboxylase family protein [Nocardia asiatica]|uniref:carboxymuconolactone decarboxylase family protein n=1 Tax=Nocardia asiatica TaxID=209252 RepID=UPI0024562682|nr:peroxidase-related enzyme [Nocardia asiatica]
MSHVSLVARNDATGATRELLDQIHAAFGATPAMFRAVANSPAALRSMWGSFQALGDGTLGSALTEQIAVAVANRNGCEYCLAAHTGLGRKAGLPEAALAAAQTGDADDPKTAALLGFALELVDRRGHVGAEQIEAVRAAGWTETELVELIAHVALNLFTNYVNVALRVPVDFPMVALR